MLVTNYNLIHSDGLWVILQDMESGEFVIAYGERGNRQECARTFSKAKAFARLEHEMEIFDAE
jgi:hypothetical protein